MNRSPRRLWWGKPTFTGTITCVNKLIGEGEQLNGSWTIEHEHTKPKQLCEKCSVAWSFKVM